MRQTPTAELRPGYRISRIIKGGWQLAGDHGPVEAERSVADMAAFAKAGITAYDCADIYTGVEEMIGRFLAQHGSDGIKVHTKYVPDRDSLATLSAKDVETVIDRSLTRLGVERLDLVQFHWWNYDVPGVDAAMGHLADLRHKGKIDQIGVTNFDHTHLETLCKVTDITSAQIQFSLLDHRPAAEFAKTARAHNVKILAYGVLAGGFLTDAWLGQPDPGFAFENRSLVKYRLIIDEFGGWDLFQTLLTTLRAIADRHDVDISTIALRAMLEHPDVTATIVGARYADRLPHTLRAFDITLSPEDHAAINTVRAQSKGPFGPVYALERDTTGPHGRIMKYNLNKGDHRLIGA